MRRFKNYGTYDLRLSHFKQGSVYDLGKPRDPTPPPEITIRITADGNPRITADSNQRITADSA